MFVKIIIYFRGYVKVLLSGYAPERFFNLCAMRNIRIWDLEYQDDHYQFCISVSAFHQLKAMLKKTKTRVRILERHGLPFFFHRYRKRKLFFGGIFVGAVLLYAMSLFIWNIEVEGNLHRTDSAIIKLLEENQVRHGMLKRELDCLSLEEMLRSHYDDVIWASAKIQGTNLIIEIQENLVTNGPWEASHSEGPQIENPSDLVADKEAEVYSIYTRKGLPRVERGAKVMPGDLLVEGKIPIFSDFEEVIGYRYCPSDADVYGITTYYYADHFSFEYEDKVFTGKQRKSFRLRLFGRQIWIPLGKNSFQSFDFLVTEHPIKIGKNFYLPLSLSKEVAKEYRISKKTYSKEQAKLLAEQKLQRFCENKSQKGVEIIQNSVIIEVKENVCLAFGGITVIEPIGKRQATTIVEIPQEEQKLDEFDGNSD